MKRHKLSAIAVMAAFGLIGLIAPAHADDEIETDAEAVPAWKSFGGGDSEQLEETFFRLAQDFAATAEIGQRFVGQVPLWPRGELKMGPVRVLPYVGESVEWESNVNNRAATGQPSDSVFGEDGRETSWNFISRAGLLADTLLMGGRLRVALSADGRWNQRPRDGQSSDFELDSQLGVTYSWPNGAWVRGGYAYERRSEPIEIEYSGDYERTNNRFFWAAGLDKDIFFGSKARMEIGMQTRDVRPSGQQYDGADRTETEFYTKVSYPFWKETTSVFVRGRYRDVNRESGSLNDGDNFGVDFGMDGNIPLSEGQYRGLRGSVSFGFDHGDYDDNNGGDDDGGSTSLAVRAALQYVISPRASADLRYIRSQQYSAYSNYQNTDRVDLTYQREIIPRLTGRVGTFYEHSDPSGESPNSGPRSPNRHSNRGGVGLGVRYKLYDWMDADAAWDYERRNGDPARRFTNHRVLVGLTIYLNVVRPQSRRTRMN